MNQLVDNLTKYPLLFYSVYFLLVFVQYPINNSLPGHSDTMYNLAVFNDYINRLSSLFISENIGRSYYPELFFQSFSELYIGQALIYIPFKILGLNDIWSYYYFISLIYALNAWAAYDFFQFIKFEKITSLLGGFLFSTNAFFLGQIEFLNGITYFFFFWALKNFIKYIHNKQYIYIIKASTLIAIQFYYSTYITLYFIIICIGIFLAKIIKDRKYTLNFKLYLACILLGILIISPILIITYTYGFINKGYSIIQTEDVYYFSLKFRDLITPLPDHNFYKYIRVNHTHDSFRIVNNGFLGFAFWILFVIGIFKSKKQQRFLFIVFTSIGLTLCIGPYFYKGPINIPAPMYIYYEYIGGTLKIASRAFSLVILSSIIYILSVFDSIETKGIKNIYIIGFVFIFFLENVPQKFTHNHYASHLSLPSSLDDYLKNKTSNDVILTLPSSLFSGKSFRNDGMSEHSREELFLYWQTIHKKNTVNGIASYMSYYRKEVDDNIHQYDWKNLIEKFHVQSFIYLKDYLVDPQETHILEKLLTAQELTKVYEDTSIVIFEPITNPSNQPTSLAL